MQDARLKNRIQGSGAKVAIMLATISGGVGLALGDQNLISASLIFSSITMVIAWGWLFINLEQAQDAEQRAGIENINNDLNSLIERLEQDNETRSESALTKDKQA